MGPAGDEPAFRAKVPSYDSACGDSECDPDAVPKTIRVRVGDCKTKRVKVAPWR